VLLGHFFEPGLWRIQPNGALYGFFLEYWCWNSANMTLNADRASLREDSLRRRTGFYWVQVTWDPGPEWSILKTVFISLWPCSPPPEKKGCWKPAKLAGQNPRKLAQYEKHSFKSVFFRGVDAVFTGPENNFARLPKGAFYGLIWEEVKFSPASYTAPRSMSTRLNVDLVGRGGVKLDKISCREFSRYPDLSCYHRINIFLRFKSRHCQDRKSKSWS
jgi:hypothetical protein